MPNGARMIGTSFFAQQVLIKRFNEEVNRAVERGLDFGLPRYDARGKQIVAASAADAGVVTF